MENEFRKRTEKKWEQDFSLPESRQNQTEVSKIFGITFCTE
jgi:hypothetical protein